MAQMLVRSPDELKEGLKKEAVRLGVTLNALILVILQDWVKNNCQ